MSLSLDLLTTYQWKNFFGCAVLSTFLFKDFLSIVANSMGTLYQNLLGGPFFVISKAQIVKIYWALGQLYARSFYRLVILLYLTPLETLIRLIIDSADIAVFTHLDCIQNRYVLSFYVLNQIGTGTCKRPGVLESIGATPIPIED